MTALAGLDISVRRMICVVVAGGISPQTKPAGFRWPW